MTASSPTPFRHMVAGATTLQVRFITGFDTAFRQARPVTLRPSEHAETFLAGEF